MNVFLQGPFPIGTAGVGPCARAALKDAASWLRRQPRESDREAGTLPLAGARGVAPGLYLLWEAGRDSGRGGPRGPSLLGFWLIFGASYAADGPAGPPDRAPPYVATLLEMATETVWWRDLRPFGSDSSRWQPLIVLEWQPEIAARSALPPPVPAGPGLGRPRGAAEERGSWLVDEHDAAPQSTGRLAAVPETDGLPPGRSVLTLVRGELRHSRSTHRASFNLIPPRALEVAEGASVATWVGAALRARTEGLPAAHELGPALLLPEGRAGFPCSGWLTRDLTLWPTTPSEIREGVLEERDIGLLWFRQLVHASSLTAGVTVAALVLGLLVFLAARPAQEEAPAPPPLAPQPALSVCSPDHQAFVEEFRCQIRHLAGGGHPEQRVCGDAGAPEVTGVLAGQDDLRAPWCGLLDRSRDGVVVETEESTFSNLAAARACFNVLGHPYTYERAAEPGQPRTRRPAPELLLEAGPLQIESLADLVGSLQKTCDELRPALERRFQGAILSLLVGRVPKDGVLGTRERIVTRGAGGLGSLPESERLLTALALQAAAPMRVPEAECLIGGVDGGVPTDGGWGALCPAARSRSEAGGGAWRALAPPPQLPAEGVGTGYRLARFSSPDKAKDPLWRCALNLDGRLPSATEPVSSEWGLEVEAPASWTDRHARLDRQLDLDAALVRMRAAPGIAGACWSVVDRLLANYEPVHPLLGPIDKLPWPSREQQLCGQICAVRYQLAQAGQEDRWLTPESDLRRCVLLDHPISDFSLDGDDLTALGLAADSALEVLGKVRSEGELLDRLGLPWNGSAEDDGWIPATAEQVCAFNLLAQGYLPTGERGLPIDGSTAFAWAGETSTSSGLAGGQEALAFRSATSLESYGRARSRSSCGHVASTCMVGGMLGVIGKAGIGAPQWPGEVNRWLDGVAHRRADDQTKPEPWCSLVQPFLPRQGALPEGELDYPCAKGVDDARVAVEAALRNFGAKAGGGL